MEKLWLIIAIVSAVVMVVSFVFAFTTRDELARALLLVLGIGAFVGTVCAWSAAGYWGLSMAILYVGATAFALAVIHGAASSSSAR